MEKRESLVSPKGRSIPHLFTDFLVVGSGVAALRCAIKLSEFGKVLLITKEKLIDSDTFEAQGGIAVAFSLNDSPQLHFEDTLKAGRGINNLEVVKILVERGKDKVEELVRWGAKFDLKGKTFHLTREGGHSRNRIIHAGGDATGREVSRVLISRLMVTPNISFMEFTFAIDLLVEEGVCRGVLAFHEKEGFIAIFSQKTILATGGVGQVYRETTNNRVITGDGIAMAYRAGCEITDMEFMQFHPTSLYIAGTSRLLISEAVRGEGGILRNKFGEPFMKKYHPEGDLAPRDVVTRGIFEEMVKTESTHVYLDATHLPYKKLKERFPNIIQACKDVGIDVKHSPIPVRPSAHYFVGGIKVNKFGETNLENLYACGECASSGLHGANRLASNSLIEGLVFGEIVGERAGSSLKKTTYLKRKIPYGEIFPEGSHLSLDLNDIKMSLKSLMARNVGIIREEESLNEAEKRIKFWSGYIMNREFFHPEGWELQNLLTIAYLIVKFAKIRKESRGVHYRSDYPEEKSSWKKHIVISKGKEVKIEKL